MQGILKDAGEAITAIGSMMVGIENATNESAKNGE
jgi:hypothetical protein